MARNERLAYEAAEASRRRETFAREDAETALIDAFVCSRSSGGASENNTARVCLWNATAADMAKTNQQQEACSVRVCRAFARGRRPDSRPDGLRVDSSVSSSSIQVCHYC